ncbi:homoserine dehydrogenase [Lacticaseibacillus zeae]|uniref:Homoserine dehydrogenase n=1 Tax=Lacticaseibacillus zeae subsp. silagei TaxID=3068307 RepID=A0ABD7Z765_LACZE|nr:MULTISPECIES: homoserine dehydrogenase [Lacticaseibacillus]MDE3315831.1 homoserine dehydrogenase [Lacticaseibacillus zeae]OFR91496.1 homoserine dehydrogenase [Lactobacillus sp. HMSC068F07]WLV82880.1 homoserine dehydrogenase [Lacticaseibacillus sp. NCIMB 15475]WLV85621.1 homoserine dehydrogenase [Lacticaseibacillus sp. NCIMB 15474]
MNIAILGFGTVGSGVYDIVANGDRRMRVTAIFIRPTHPATMPEMTTDFDAILADPSIDVVVEAIGGLHPAYDYILRALRHGKHVVTANKAVVARYLPEFITTAEQHHVRFYFEATTGGGIPWIRNLERAARIDQVDTIEGIFNGTSNYILDQMQRAHLDFDPVLLAAKDMGYAEADPSADIDGDDIVNKLKISAALAYNMVPPRDVPKFGIRHVSKADIDFFAKHHQVLRLIGKSKRIGDHYSMVVEPRLYPATALAANTFENFNLIRLHGQTIGDLQFYGQGAGKYPTANAIVQDLFDILEKVTHLKRDFKQTLQFDPDLSVADYLLRADPLTFAMFNDKQTEVIDHRLLIKQIPVGEMHRLMRGVLAIDAHAFMAAIGDSELVARDVKQQLDQEVIG